MSPLLHFVDKQNVSLRFRGVPGKIVCFISWFRLKIIVVGRYTTRPDCRFTDSFPYNLDLPIIWIKIIRSTLQEVFCTKGFLRNFAKSMGKHLCQSLFFNKVAGLSFFCLFLQSCFVLLFSFASLFFEIKNKYSDAHSTMRADEW